jgi:dienelactone hydrolase
MSAPLLLAVLSACTSVPGAGFDPVTQDPPADAAFPASSRDVSFDSHGARLSGRLFLASGAGPHPTIVIARGMPDLLGSLDIAMALRRAGFHVLSFNNRGCWGSEGTFTLRHSYEDVESAVNYLRSDWGAKQQRVDPDRISLMGFSWGGPVVLKAAAADPRVRAVALLDATDMRSDIDDMRAHPQETVDWLASMGAVRMTTPRAVVDEIIADADFWDPLAARASLAGKDVLVVVATKGTGSEPPQVPSLKDAFRDVARVEAVTMDTNHTFDDHRQALARTVVSWALGVLDR